MDSELAAAVDAQQLIDALHKAGFPVKGLIIKDVDDPTTWTFVGLDEAQRPAAVALVADLLHPIQVPPPVTLLTQRALWLLFTGEEYLALAKSADAAVVRLKAVLRASESFDPTAVWVAEFFNACVGAEVLSRKRADDLYLAVNPPV